MMETKSLKLCIFSVKRLIQVNGKIYTYGGFGDYLHSISEEFRTTTLVAHIKKQKKIPKGWYEIQNKDISYVWLPQIKTEIDTWLNMIANFYKCMKAAKKADICHARMPNWTGILGAISARIYRKKLFISVIADWYIEAQRMSVFKKYGLGFPMKVNYYLYDFFERVVCKNQLVFAQGLTPFQKHKNNCRCHFVYSSAHYENEVLAKKKKNEFSYRLLTVARLTGIKNQNILLEALHELKKFGPWKLDIVGDGPKLEELKSLSYKLDLDSDVSFHGMLERGDSIWKIYDQCDIFLLPSLSEGTPKVILEAMARGLIVLTSDIPNLSHTLKGNKSLLFNPNDKSDLVEKIKYVGKNFNKLEIITKENLNFSKKTTVEAQHHNMIKLLKEHFNDEEK